MTDASPADQRDTAIEVAVRSTDMDADRNVNNAVYFQYFEQSRLEHLRRYAVIDWPPRVDAGRPQFALVQTEARFHAPAIHPDVLVVWTRTASIGTTSFSLAYQIRRRSDGTAICEGRSVQVWLDANGRPTAIAPAAQQALERSRHPEITATDDAHGDD